MKVTNSTDKTISKKITWKKKIPVNANKGFYEFHGTLQRFQHKSSINPKLRPIEQLNLSLYYDE